MNRLLPHAAFAAGLSAVAWTAAGYGPGNPLALTLVLLIAAFYLAGAAELRRFSRDTETLARQVEQTTAAPETLAGWLEALPAGLRHAVRLRVEGERVALPGPALAPYLAGLLVLLGMLGTFLGMVVTLKGTGLALEHASDVEAIRASLAAPVKGLGLAFGTSVAGVAASAMLGLMAALLRRERQQAGRRLDAAIAGALRGFSRSHQREQSLRLLQAQAGQMPALVEQLQGLVAQIERQARTQDERLLAEQRRFHDEAARAYSGLAESVGRSLQASLAESTRLAAAAIEPAVQATMNSLAQENAALNTALTAAVREHLDGVDTRLQAGSAALAAAWQAALDSQQRHGEASAQNLEQGLERFTTGFESRAGALLDGLTLRLDEGAARWATSWGEALAEQRRTQQEQAAHSRETMAAAAAALDQHARALQAEAASARTAAEEAAAARDSERLAALDERLTATVATLLQTTRQAAEAGAEQQQRICTTLERSAQQIAEQAQAQARATIAEIGQLVDAAAQAPRAAAEVMGELRRSLSDSLVRDNAALEERNRLLVTLAELLDAVGEAGREQRATLAALVQTSAEQLERVGARFAAGVEAQLQALDAVAAQVGAGAGELASLGEGFGQAVQLFAHSSEQSSAQLKSIEAALGQALARSDEQLAYYVAQAREIVDLTLGAHKQFVDELQQRSAAEAGAA
ncbi:DUF802 domain-containing protein [Rubrivivax gelatinosus]|uniref:DUF802 domain-containing protein n=1 Tax=Rubrivivax gelatinosus TaxID=28068 RepID=A0ABS1DR97_RUBGE|nr:DUF802 domain-containing protein [Rubrivivax gelatinosus]MBK1711978.1 hypothetical protein [Rubrivivax gelatinosus]